MNESRDNRGERIAAGWPAATSGHVGFLLEIDGDRIARASADIGHQHRGIEKLAESRSYFDAVRLMGRLDCRSPGTAAVALCLAVEKLAGIAAPERARLIRTVACEMWRVSEHLQCVSNCFAAAGLASAAGNLSASRFEIERAARDAFGRGAAGIGLCIGGLRRDIAAPGVEAIMRSLRPAERCARSALSAAASDGAFAGRARGLAVLSEREALSLGVSGPALRACGVARDARRDSPYLSYARLRWDLPLDSSGDALGRVMVRLHEVLESLGIVEQALGMLSPGAVISRCPRFCLPEKHEVYGTVQGAARHFRMTLEGMRPPAGEVYLAVEAAAGELGMYIVSEGGCSPQRLRIASPSFALCQAAQAMLGGAMIEDLPLALASLGIKAQEMDR